MIAFLTKIVRYFFVRTNPDERCRHRLTYLGAERSWRCDRPAGHFGRCEAVIHDRFGAEIATIVVDSGAL